MGRKSSSLEQPLINCGRREPSQALGGPSHQPQFLWSSSYSLQDSGRLTSWACLHQSGKELKLCHVTLGVRAQIRRREPCPMVVGGGKRSLIPRRPRHLARTEPQGLDFHLEVTTSESRNSSPLTLSPGGPMGPAPPGSPRAPLLPSSPAGPGAPWGPAGP